MPAGYQFATEVTIIPRIKLELPLEAGSTSHTNVYKSAWLCLSNLLDLHLKDHQLLELSPIDST